MAVATFSRFCAACNFDWFASSENWLTATSPACASRIWSTRAAEAAIRVAAPASRSSSATFGNTSDATPMTELTTAVDCVQFCIGFGFLTFIAACAARAWASVASSVSPTSRCRSSSRRTLLLTAKSSRRDFAAPASPVRSDTMRLAVSGSVDFVATAAAHAAEFVARTRADCPAGRLPVASTTSCVDASSIADGRFVTIEFT